MHCLSTVQMYNPSVDVVKRRATDSRGVQGEGFVSYPTHQQQFAFSQRILITEIHLELVSHRRIHLSRYDPSNRTRALVGLAVSLLLVNAAFVFWPDFENEDAGAGAQTLLETEEIEIVDIEQTTQSAAEAPPPPPPNLLVPPEEVPDEVIVEEVVQEILETIPVEEPDPTAPPGPPPAPPAPQGTPGPPSQSGTSDEPRTVEHPTRSPRMVRQVLPVYPETLKGDGFRARVVVEVLISEVGRVMKARVTQRFRLRGDREEPIASLPPAMEAAAIDAANRSMFRPAEEGGERVRAWTSFSLSFDPRR